MLIQCLPPSNEEVLSGPTGGGGGVTAGFPFGSLYTPTPTHTRARCAKRGGVWGREVEQCKRAKLRISEHSPLP